ncbi:MAG: PLP-dependent transferase [Gammaproteobacteria bacterium]|nr:PLP-dependent transferase [Gammaproteobacteria bacterium]
MSKRQITTRYKLATLVAQATHEAGTNSTGIIPPVHLSTTYQRDADNGYSSGFSYGRPDNPTIRHLESVLTKLEEGEEALAFGSGMAAATAVFQSLQPGDHVIAPRVMYWSLRNWLTGMATQWGLQVSFVTMDDPAALEAEIKPGITRLIWVETPANPLWSITDIQCVSEIAHAVGALLVVDSTVATPVLTKPLLLGADIVMHSASKYLNGHSDVLAGILVASEQSEFWLKIKNTRTSLGGILSPRDASELIRGLRTLHLRVRESSLSALVIARHFELHAGVSSVLYPGLPNHPGYELARKQMTGGFGGMLSLRIKGGELSAIKVAAEVKLWKRATSLGGVESLIEHRASIEGAGTPVPDDLLRLSVGIEAVEDLISDLEAALASI